MKPHLATSLVALLVCALVASAVPAQPIPIFVSGKDRAYEILQPDETRLMTLRGPGELRLVHRARFKPAMENGLSYSLFLRVNGGEEYEVVYDKVERSRTAMFRDGTLGVPGRLLDHIIELGRGYHNVEIRTKADNPEIFFRDLFQKKRERRRNWVEWTPSGSPQQVDLVVREALVPYFRNEPNRPFEVEIIGPTELRIFTRIENTPDMRGRIHYRLQIRSGGKVVNTFQLSSRRSDITAYLEEDHLVPGRAAEIAIPIPEGRHRLEIQPLDPDKSTLLARFMIPREDLALTTE